MKYFAAESPTASNRSVSKTQRQATNRKFLRNLRAYHKQLHRLEGRISQQAWNFFNFGFGRWGLHDAHLLSFAVGDGLDHPIDGRTPFKYNKEKAKVRILILNRHQNVLCSFDCANIRRMVFNYPVQDSRRDWHRIDYLETYELTAVNKRYLSLEFLFSSNATLLVEFGRLKFRRHRVNHCLTNAAHPRAKLAS